MATIQEILAVVEKAEPLQQKVRARLDDESSRLEELDQSWSKDPLKALQQKAAVRAELLTPIIIPELEQLEQVARSVRDSLLEPSEYADKWLEHVQLTRRAVDGMNAGRATFADGLVPKLTDFKQVGVITRALAEIVRLRLLAELNGMTHVELASFTAPEDRAIVAGLKKPVPTPELEMADALLARWPPRPTSAWNHLVSGPEQQSNGEVAHQALSEMLQVLRTTTETTNRERAAAAERLARDAAKKELITRLQRAMAVECDVPELKAGDRLSLDEARAYRSRLARCCDCTELDTALAIFAEMRASNWLLADEADAIEAMLRDGREAYRHASELSLQLIAGLDELIAAATPSAARRVPPHPVVATMLAKPSAYVAERTELYRERFYLLGTEAMADLLDAAISTTDVHKLLPLVEALADDGYPPAIPHFLRWLLHQEPNVACTSMVSLCRIARRELPTLPPERDALMAVVRREAAALLAWWEENGAMAEAAWKKTWAERGPREPLAADKIRFDPALIRWVYDNNSFALLGTGRVVQEPTTPLPLYMGWHLAPGVATVDGRPVRVVFMLNSEAAKIGAIWIPEPEASFGWRNVYSEATELQQRFQLASM